MTRRTPPVWASPVQRCREKTGITEASMRGVHLEQLTTFGAVDRDPRMRVVSVAYLALTAERPTLSPGLEYTTLATTLAGPDFTLGEFQHVYEVVWGQPLQRANFRRRVLKTPGFVESMGCTPSRQNRRCAGDCLPTWIREHPGATDDEGRAVNPASADGAWTMDQLLEAEASGLRIKFLFLWGHTSPAGGGIGSHVLSQWYEHPFTVEGVTYPSAEHHMMASKARLFGDDEHLGLILAATSPGEAKARGGSVRDFAEDIWERHRFDIVVGTSVAKFSSDDELRSYLVGTGDRVLVEASPRDRIWGIGMSRDDPGSEHPSHWRGLNLLGFALMEARARLA